MVPSKRQSILIVDDNQQRKMALSSRLRMQGYTIDIATGGFHSIHLIEKNHYNLVLIIDDMEDMAAHETIGLIRACKSSSGIPVIVLRSSGRELEQDVLNIINRESPAVVAPWQDEFRSVLRQINSHIA
ncbi:MAG: hypothetical protein CME71_08590 [Halobacteriovorax sp.]|nr:hypothetical protein [Halobacteriovorax sp.]